VGIVGQRPTMANKILFNRKWRKERKKYKHKEAKQS
jgi:hypothetical protein